jgi:hypothetical protein
MDGLGLPAWRRHRNTQPTSAGGAPHSLAALDQSIIFGPTNTKAQVKDSHVIIDWLLLNCVGPCVL